MRRTALPSLLQQSRRLLVTPRIDPCSGRSHRGGGDDGDGGRCGGDGGGLPRGEDKAPS